MKYLLRVETQEELPVFTQRRLAKFVLETAPSEVTVTKVEIEDQQTGSVETVNRGETQ